MPTSIESSDKAFSYVFLWGSCSIIMMPAFVNEVTFFTEIALEKPCSLWEHVQRNHSYQ